MITMYSYDADDDDDDDERVKLIRPHTLKNPYFLTFSAHCKESRVPRFNTALYTTVPALWPDPKLRP